MTRSVIYELTSRETVENERAHFSLSERYKESRVADLIKNLASKSDVDLMKMLENANRVANDPRAIRLKQEIFRIWQDKAVEFLRNRITADLDDKGVLSAFGYRVGHQGIRSQEIRQQKLELIMNANIPPIISPTYLHEWGAPNSFKRKRKLVRILSKFIRGAENRTRNRLSYRLAKTDWETDLRFVQAF